MWDLVFLAHESSQEITFCIKSNNVTYRVMPKLSHAQHEPTIFVFALLQFHSHHRWCTLLSFYIRTKSDGGCLAIIPWIGSIARRLNGIAMYQSFAWQLSVSLIIGGMLVIKNFQKFFRIWKRKKTTQKFKEKICNCSWVNVYIFKRNSSLLSCYGAPLTLAPSFSSSS